MDFNTYQRLAQRTSNAKTFHEKLVNGALGLNGEAGEVADIVKKYMYQGHNLAVSDLIEELGDVLWYVAETAAAYGIDLDNIATGNIRKLEARYPEGHFDSGRSIKREPI